MIRRFWTEADTLRLMELYPDQATAEIAKILKRSVRAVYGTAHKLGLKKSHAFLSSEASGRILRGMGHHGSERTRFPKGHVPANKGLRRPGYNRGRMRETQFKKGCRSGMAAKNWKPLGTILPDTEGYFRIKVREAEHGKEATGFGNTKVWPLLNRHVWEQHKGPIPPKHIVAFKDGNRANCAIDNLELISRKENARRNRMWTVLPRELAEAIHLNGQLKRKLRRIQNGKE